MTAAPGPVPFFGLRVVFGSGPWPRAGQSYIPPTADYACPCGWTDAAYGPAAVARFAHREHGVAAQHSQHCQLRTERHPAP
ncbi:hypothetical protein ACFYS8_13275 [Kitasatospora sp. NPDC004615]|uniref:hypothetical protein n=1 Tax=unclassified Kitasatospora TaxID=2633591 RepID=UPI0036CBEE99